MPMFDMANDSDRFRTREDLEALGAEFDGWAWTRTNPDGIARWLPLYEAKQLGIYDHRVVAVVKSRTAVQWQNQPRPLTDADKDDPNREAVGRYWIKLDEAEVVLAPQGSPECLLAWSLITSATNWRTTLPRVRRLGDGPSAVGT